MGEERVREYEGVEQGQIVMPFYLICDVSYSMVEDMDALNEGLKRLRRAIVSQPVVDDVAHICLITFSDTAKVVMPLAQLSEHAMPTLAVEGGTSYGAAFRELAHTITRDAAALRGQGYRVYRPCAFFLSDGEPLDHDWLQTFRATLNYDRSTGTGMKMHPVFIPFGFRDAPEDVLRTLAYPVEKGKWFHTKSHDIEEALEGILSVIMKTVVSSGQSVSSGKPALIMPKPPTGSAMAYGDAEEFI
jgi:uncharacterized protein YegL